MRKFDSGAIRDIVEDKFDFEGFLSPLVLNRYAEYMNKHRKQSDGNLRDSDNWQKGIPMKVYMKSGFRHFFDWWANYRQVETVVKEDVEESLCGLLFNTMGYLHEYLIDKADEYNVVEYNGFGAENITEPSKPRFKVNDEVKIILRANASDFIQDLCKKASYRGFYNGNKGSGHYVMVNSTVYWFYFDEIFPVEDD